VHTVHNGEISTAEQEWKSVTLAEGGVAGRQLMELLHNRKIEEELISTGRKLVSQAQYTGTVTLSSEDLDMVTLLCFLSTFTM
jgi:hypothetical protein